MSVYRIFDITRDVCYHILMKKSLTKSESLKKEWAERKANGWVSPRKGISPKNLSSINKNKKGQGNPMWGKHTSQKQKESVKRGDEHPAWKGDKVGYSALHDWLIRKYGKPNKCENLLCSKKGKKVFHLSNITGKYTRNKQEWAWLCVTCHNRFDKGLSKIFIKNHGK